MKAYFRFIIRFRYLIIALTAIITILSGWMITRGVISSTIGGMFLGENPAYKSYLQRSEDFGNNDAVILALESPDLLSPDTLSKLELAVKVSVAHKYIHRVSSLLDVQLVQGNDDGLIVESYVDHAKNHPEKADSILERLSNDPLAKGLLISEDGRHTAIVMEIDANADLPAEVAPELILDIRKAFVDAGFDEDTIHVVGVPASIAAIIEQTYFNIKQLLPIVCIVLLVTVWIMFRRLWPAVITMGVSGIAMAWTMGFSVLLDRQITIVASMIPAVIIIIAFSDVVHLCSAYLLELGRNDTKSDAIMACGEDVGKACLLTSITTFFGFVAMSFVPAPVFRHLGVVLGFGVGTALIIAVTLVPILFHMLPRPKPWRAGTTGRVQDFLDKFLSKSADVTLNRPWAIIGIFVIVAIFAVMGLMRFDIETNFAERISEDHQLRADISYFGEHFDGSNMVDIFIDAPKRDGLIEPDVFSRIAAFQDAAVKLPEVSRAFSLVDLMRTMHKEMNGGYPAADLPDTRPAYAQYLLSFEMAGGEELERLVDFNRQTMRMTLQLPNDDVRHTFEVGYEVAKIARAHLGDRVTIEATGLMYLMGQWLENIVNGQKRGLIFAVITIAIMMTIGLRSVNVGMWSMLPNLFPLFVLGGVLGFVWGDVDSDLMALGMIAIGIGVDDTIHFLMRMRIESKRASSMEEAIRRTFHFSGRGILITTVILVAGFAPFALSDYLSVNVLGNFLPMTLVVALVADLYLVPALVTLGVMRFNRFKKAA